MIVGCAAPNGARIHIAAYPHFRLRVRSPQCGLTCGRASGAWIGGAIAATLSVRSRCLTRQENTPATIVAIAATSGLWQSLLGLIVMLWCKGLNAVLFCGGAGSLVRNDFEAVQIRLGLTGPTAIFSAHTASLPSPSRTPSGSRASSREASIVPRTTWARDPRAWAAP